ncbi:hypothetical protein ON010_g12795 [Phytophthora cinnamomi]|nr:hypothetical protein ON010_g12795 [Phytophthora cinnamomi]
MRSKIAVFDTNLTECIKVDPSWLEGVLATIDAAAEHTSQSQTPINLVATYRGSTSQEPSAAPNADPDQSSSSKWPSQAQKEARRRRAPVFSFQVETLCRINGHDATDSSDTLPAIAGTAIEEPESAWFLRWASRAPAQEAVQQAFIQTRPQLACGTKQDRTVKVKLENNNIGEATLELVKMTVRLDGAPNYQCVAVVFDIPDEFDFVIGMPFSWMNNPRSTGNVDASRRTRRLETQWQKLQLPAGSAVRLYVSSFTEL